MDRGGQVEFVRAYGFAHRGYEIPNAVDTRFGIASGTKGLTALAVISLIEQDALRLSTTARSVLGKDLPLIGDDVTIEHLLAHRSGIGDYVDEEAGYDITDYVMTVPVHELATTEQYLAVLDRHPAKFSAGARFCYCNSGYVVLALIAERVSGVPFHDLVRHRVCARAGMRDTAFFRSDELPDRTAVGYLPIEGVSRTNVFHLPVRGSGDGGIDLLHDGGPERLLAVVVRRHHRLTWRPGTARSARAPSSTGSRPRPEEAHQRRHGHHVPPGDSAGGDRAAAARSAARAGAGRQRARGEGNGKRETGTRIVQIDVE